MSKEDTVKGKLDVVSIIKGISREETSHIDTRTKVIPRKRETIRGGGKNWRDHLEEL